MEAEEEEGQLLQLAAFELPSWKREKKEGRAALVYFSLQRPHGPKRVRRGGRPFLAGCCSVVAVAPVCF